MCHNTQVVAMRRFMDSLRSGTFVASYCTVCKKKNWPPYEYCSLCYRKTSTANISKVGRVVEFSTSRLEGSEIVVALIDMDGILILGSILGSRNITIGSKVILTACGASPNLYFHFRQQDRFDSYT